MKSLKSSNYHLPYIPVMWLEHHVEKKAVFQMSVICTICVAATCASNKLTDGFKQKTNLHIREDSKSFLLCLYSLKSIYRNA